MYMYNVCENVLHGMYAIDVAPFEIQYIHYTIIPYLIEIIIMNGNIVEFSGR